MECPTPRVSRYPTKQRGPLPTGAGAGLARKTARLDKDRPALLGTAGLYWALLGYFFWATLLTKPDDSAGTAT